MQTILLIANKPQAIQIYLDRLLKNEAISPFDVQTIDIGEGETKKTSIGIAEIRTLQKTSFLMPSQGKKKAVIINDAHLLTIEAQNALLKLLEEPPEYTVLVLTTPNSNQLLATILSRCHIITLGTGQRDEKDTAFSDDILQRLPISSVSTRLKIAQDAAKKDPVGWIDDMIMATRNMIINAVNDNASTHVYSTILRQLQNAHKELKTTAVNPRLLLENLLLSLPYTHTLGKQNK